MHTSPVALVTGASRGIGRGIALELARAGHSVLINYAGNAAAAEECRALCRQAAPAQSSASFETVQADLSKEADRQRLVETTLCRFGKIDLLVNNAGVAPDRRADLLEATEESFDRLIAINLKGPFFLTQRVARHWLKAAETWPARGARPKIVTISSISAYTASVNRGDYCVSKAALAMLTPLFAARLAEVGVRVYEIRPGIIATDMTGPVKERYDKLIVSGLTPIRRWGAPEDVGRAVVALANEAFPFSTGEVINVDGGFHLRTL
ncbi:MAG: 3-ketoacyl-ACP reductase [Verrucomicrobiae bacterium]|nr:3-ketoacyl-ACP reductase [Verrucomicrobiae bacterium]